MRKIRLSPGLTERHYLINKGEFSLEAEEGFEKHLRSLKKAVGAIKARIKDEGQQLHDYKDYVRKIYMNVPPWY